MSAEPEPVVAYARMAHAGQRFAFPLPDALMAMILALAASLDFLSPSQLAYVPRGFLASRDELMFGIFVEGGFLMMQGTLIDIATRLKKRPPIWAVALIAGVVLLFSDYAKSVLSVAWDRGMLIFVPLLFSIVDRAAVLWYLPGRTRTGKIAARALIANRMFTGLVLLGAYAAVAIFGLIFRDYYNRLNGPWVMLLAGAIYFAVAAFDEWRVRGRRFAEKPTVLFGFDMIHLELVDAPVL
jgi:hypothetical protein